MNNYDCRHCKRSLDAGDVWLELIKPYKDSLSKRTLDRCKDLAKQYGWSPATPVRFTKEVLVDAEGGGRKALCYYCGEADPLPNQFSCVSPVATTSGSESK